MFRSVLLAAVLIASVLVGVQQAEADVYVPDYYRQDGTHVPSHYRSDPDDRVDNNWSTYPNVNPHTGKVGTRR